MTISELSRITGESTTNLSRWLSGERRISLQKAQEIEEKTGLPKEIFVNKEIQKRYITKGKRK